MNATPSGRGARRRPLLITLAVLVIIAVVAFFAIVGPGPMAFSKGPKVDLADYHAASPSGVPAALAQASLIKKGEYLAKAADCQVCHTAKGGEPYAGGFAFVLPFGTLYSTNITPDKATGIGSYTDAQFLAAVHRGVRQDGANLYPAMPYTSYTYITDADALAIKAYLFSLAPIEAPNKANALAFPFNQRWAMSIWSALFNANERFKPDTEKSAEWNRGAYIAEALAHCGECHTPRNPAFALNNRKKFGGALTAGWRAYNISSNKETGVGAWHDEELAAYLAGGHAAGHGSAAGPMGEAVDESFSQLAPEDVHAIVAYLRSVPSSASSDLPASLAPPAPDSHKEGLATAESRGKQVYEGACVSCHGWSGVSDISDYATLTGARAVNDPHGTNVAQIVLAGMKRSSPEGVTEMPGFGAAYSDSDIAAVANYVTTRFGSSASKLEAADIAKMRRETAQ
ncbi:MAG TPA: c-type cytochrome [Steroidobacteraceae bacterium]|nr:c-type cytochrome [Steroidobacteraceae bacterium]